MNLARVYPEDPALVPFRAGLHFSFFNALTWQIATGTPLVLLAELLGASPAQASLAYSFVFLLTPVQILSTALLPRFGYRKLTLGGWGLRSFLLLIPLGLAFLAPITGAKTWMVYALIASCFGFCLLRAVGMAASLPWFYSILPSESRGLYFASDQLFGGISCMIALITCTALFLLLPPFTAVAVQYLIAIIGSAMSFRALRTLPDGPPPPNLSMKEIGTGLRRLALAVSPYRSYLWVTIACFIVTTPIAPFAAYYLKAAAGLPSWLIMVFELLRYSGSALGAWALSRRTNAKGARPYLIVSLGLYGLLSVYWLLFLHEGLGGHAGLIAAYLVMGFAGTCWMVGHLTYLPKLLRPEDHTLGITLQGALASLAGGVATTVWGLFLRPSGGGQGMDLVAFQILFIVASIVCAILALALMRLPEPDSPGIEPLMPGSILLRPHRAMSYLVNLIDPRR